MARTDAAPRVLQVFEPPVTGVPVYVARLCEGLAERGVQVDVAGPEHSPLRERMEAAACSYTPLEFSSPARAARGLRAALEETGARVVHAHSSKAGALTGVVARRSGVPSLYTPHAWAFQMRRRPMAMRAGFAAAERLLCRRFHSQVVAVSHSERRAAERWRVTAPGAVEVVRTGLPEAPYENGRTEARRALGLSEDGVVAAWVGRLGAQKRPQDLPPLARAVRGRATLVALGHGMSGSAEGRALVAEGGVVADEGQDADRVLAAADLYVQTSMWEGLSLSVLEAMRAGLPVLAYATDGLDEQVEHGRSGRLTPVGDVDGLARDVCDLAVDPALRRRMGDEGGRRLRSDYSFPSMVDRLERLYSRAAADRENGPRE